MSAGIASAYSRVMDSVEADDKEAEDCDFDMKRQFGDRFSCECE